MPDTADLKPLLADPEFELEELRRKYAAERDKRLRADGPKQYQGPVGKFERYRDTDPYVAEPLVRDPLDIEIDVVVIGGGFAGLMAAARLRSAGIDDFRVIEAGSDFGGTWYWNRYPGAQCDVESYCYLPLLEETNYVPKEKYSYAEEIFGHSQRIGDHFDLYENGLFQTRVAELRWNEESKRWHVRTDRGDDIKARFVITAVGGTYRIKLPGIPGIEKFKGHSFHTARWDYDYTGGDIRGGMTKLADKTVAVIGTGATAIQCVPYLAKDAKQLYVFQRTPSSVDLRRNAPTDPEWKASLKPGWQRERMHNFNEVMSGRPVEVDLVNDGWTEVFSKGIAAGFTLSAEQVAPKPEEMVLAAEIADHRKMNKVRERVDQTVKDTAVAEALKPWYRLFCKRPTFNGEYLPTFNRSNVTLVDVSESKGVDRITEDGIVANGQEYKVDCIIFSTGFDTSGTFLTRCGFETIGRGGMKLSDRFAQGMRTMHGHSTNGFPNWFFIGVGQNALSANMTSMFDDQARHVAYIIKEVMNRGKATVEATAEAVDAWAAEIKAKAGEGSDFFANCTPGYYNNEGQFNGEGLLGLVYTPGTNAFNALLANWREEGRLDGMALRD